MAIVRNLATVKTTADITSSVTSIPVNRVDVFGASKNPLDNPFYVTIMPASGDEPANSTNSEIVLVTGISGSNLTVTRGQRSTTAKAFNSGAIVTMAIYAEDAVLLGGEGSAVGNPAPWVDTSDIKNVAVTTDKIADGAVKSEKIDWATFDDSWHNITLNSDITVGNANFTHSNNRWRYENGGRDIRIQLNVGNSNGTQVPAGQSKNFTSASQFSFMPNGKFMRLCGSGQASSLVWVEINTTSSSFVRFTPITGPSSYCALDVLIPKP